MAKKRKKRATKKRRSFISNPRKRRATPKRRARRRSSYRRNPGKGPIMDVAMLGLGTIGGALAIPRAVALIPKANSMVKNIIGVVASGALAVFGRKSKIALGAGLGGVAMCGKNLVTNAIPALNGDELTQDEAETLAMEYASEELDGPLDAPLDAPLEGALNGDMNSQPY